ncbi:MAG: hypothetical protein WD423_08715 [Rhodothermales bacterium]
MSARSGWHVYAASAIAWLVAGFAAVPPLLEWIHASGLIPAISNRPLGFFLGEWYGIVVYGFAAGTAGYVFVRGLKSPDFSARIVPDARPSDLGAIRALVSSTLLISTLWEDPASTAALPAEMMQPLGVMHLLALLPGYESVAASAGALTFLKWFTALVLFLSAIGWKARWTVPFGAVMYLILGGWLRQYAWFYHTGLLALYLQAVLAFLPSGRGLSIDRIRQRRRGEAVEPDVPSRRFGWARYAVWTTMALPYVAAGLSKLRNGGLTWWDASNFKFILFQSTLRPMEFDFSISLELATAPPWLFEALALSALVGELLYGLVLFSRKARWVMPVLMLLMHVGILLLQNILFFDLILLQLIYLNFRPILSAASDRILVLDRLLAQIGAGLRSRGFFTAAPHRPAPTRSADPGRRLTVAVVVVVTACWVFRVEFYPFTGMQMFSQKRSEPVVYERVLAHLHSGDVIRAPIEKSVPAMSDGRFRRVLARAFNPVESHQTQAFLDVVIERWNRHAAEPDRIRRIEIQQWEWHYDSDPGSADYGHMLDRFVYPADEPAPDDASSSSQTRESSAVLVAASYFMISLPSGS